MQTNVSCKSTQIKENDYQKPDFPTRERSTDEKSKDNSDKLLIIYIKKILSDPSNVSLTKKFVSIELAETEVNVRTAGNVGLAECIFVNYNNPNAKLPYAVSADCYCVFCDFFGPLIDYIHGPPQTEACLEPMFGDVEKYEVLDLNFNKRSRVIYSDVTLRRNFDNFPFTPAMNDTNRKKIIEKLEGPFRKVFKDEEEIAEMPSEWEFKFDKIKNELDDLGAMRNYPSDRLHMIFQSSNDINQGVVLNFDDHMQIITSSYDGRIGKLYSRMHEIYTNENLDDFEYVAHPYLGFLTLSPAHVGTGLTIRIIAKFPFVSRMANLEMSILKNRDIVVEPENPDCPSSGTLLIYNKKTLNKTEEEIFNDILISFKILYDIEEELEAITPMAVQNDSMPVESLNRLVNMISKSESKSYTKKYLTSNVISEYENVKTRFGNTLNHCIRGNAIYPESLYPRTTDVDCFMKFRQFFTPILYEINKIRSTTHATRPDYGLAGENSQYMLHHRDILSYRVRFARNFERFAFPNAMSDKDRDDVERIMTNTFDEFPLEIEGQYVPLDKIKSTLYYEDFIFFNLLPELTDVEKSIGCARDWPRHRGIFFGSKDPKFPDLILLVFINITEHIKVVCLDHTGKSLHACYDRAVKVMKFLDLRFEKLFARKPGYGFLLSFPQSVGCGLRISAKVFLKNLGNNREVLERKCQAYNFAYRGSSGAGTPAMNNIFDLSLKLNMNVTEKWILLTFCQRLKEIVYAEREYDIRIPKPSNSIFIENSSNDCETSIMKSHDELTETDLRSEDNLPQEKYDETDLSAEMKPNNVGNKENDV